jgi:cellulose synthase operon protein YhjQ
MGSRGTEIDDHVTADTTPEDVAALYSWAKLQGAKYRDYSASRREYRAQVRYRAAKAELDREVRAQADAEGAAIEAERAAADAEAMARAAAGDQGEVWRAQSMLAAEKASGRAAAERVEAARRAELSARLAVVALREEREIAEAHASAKRQTMLYERTDIRLRQLAGPQPHGRLEDEDFSPGPDEGEMLSEIPDDLQQFLFPGWQDFAGTTVSDEVRDDRQTRSAAGNDESYRTLDDLDGEPSWGGRSTPAWLFSAEAALRPEAMRENASAQLAETLAGETLFDSREQLASRWFALKGVFDDAGPELAAMPQVESRGAATPLLAFFSLAGGVGKTSLAAAIASGLASQGEGVVLADTTSQGLLPIYFGLHELQPGATHRIELEGEAGGGTISLMMRRVARADGGDAKSEVLVEQILRSIAGNHRVVLDLATGADWLIRRLAERRPTVLVPVTPDINSVMSLQAVERLFRGIMDSQQRPLLPLYVLNQFDASLPLHLDIREVFRRKLGDRLARVAIRRSSAVGEALAEGTTVAKYAPDDPVAQDYRDIVAWLRGLTPPAGEAFRGLRRGEQ